MAANSSYVPPGAVPPALSVPFPALVGSDPVAMPIPPGAPGYLTDLFDTGLDDPASPRYNPKSSSDHPASQSYNPTSPTFEFEEKKASDGIPDIVAPASRELKYHGRTFVYKDLLELPYYPQPTAKYFYTFWQRVFQGRHPIRNTPDPALQNLTFERFLSLGRNAQANTYQLLTTLYLCPQQVVSHLACHSLGSGKTWIILMVANGYMQLWWDQLRQQPTRRGQGRLRPDRKCWVISLKIEHQTTLWTQMDTVPTLWRQYKDYLCQSASLTVEDDKEDFKHVTKEKSVDCPSANDASSQPLTRLQPKPGLKLNRAVTFCRVMEFLDEVAAGRVGPRDRILVDEAHLLTDFNSLEPLNARQKRYKLYQALSDLRYRFSDLTINLFTATPVQSHPELIGALWNLVAPSFVFPNPGQPNRNVYASLYGSGSMQIDDRLLAQIQSDWKANRRGYGQHLRGLISFVDITKEPEVYAQVREQWDAVLWPLSSYATTKEMKDELETKRIEERARRDDKSLSLHPLRTALAQSPYPIAVFQYLKSKDRVSEFNAVFQLVVETAAHKNDPDVVMRFDDVKVIEAITPRTKGKESKSKSKNSEGHRKPLVLVNVYSQWMRRQILEAIHRTPVIGDYARPDWWWGYWWSTFWSKFVEPAIKKQAEYEELQRQARLIMRQFARWEAVYETSIWGIGDMEELFLYSSTGRSLLSADDWNMFWSLDGKETSVTEEQKKFAMERIPLLIKLKKSSSNPARGGGQDTVRNGGHTIVRNNGHTIVRSGGKAKRKARDTESPKREKKKKGESKKKTSGDDDEDPDSEEEDRKRRRPDSDDPDSDSDEDDDVKSRSDEKEEHRAILQSLHRELERWRFPLTLLSSDAYQEYKYNCQWQFLQSSGSIRALFQCWSKALSTMHVPKSREPISAITWTAEFHWDWGRVAWAGLLETPQRLALKGRDFGAYLTQPRTRAWTHQMDPYEEFLFGSDQWVRTSSSELGIIAKEWLKIDVSIDAFLRRNRSDSFVSSDSAMDSSRLMRKMIHLLNQSKVERVVAQITAAPQYKHWVWSSDTAILGEIANALESQHQYRDFTRHYLLKTLKEKVGSHQLRKMGAVVRQKCNEVIRKIDLSSRDTIPRSFIWLKTKASTASSLSAPIEAESSKTGGQGHHHSRTDHRHRNHHHHHHHNHHHPHHHHRIGGKAKSNVVNLVSDDDESDDDNRPLISVRDVKSNSGSRSPVDKPEKLEKAKASERKKRIEDDLLVDPPDDHRLLNPRNEALVAFCFNHPNNCNGKAVHVLLGSFTESISIKNAMKVHIVGRASSYAEELQAIARALRYRSHEPNTTVTVVRYEGWLDGGTLDLSADKQEQANRLVSQDEYFAGQQYLQKLMVSELLQLMANVSVDCVANLSLTRKLFATDCIRDPQDPPIDPLFDLDDRPIVSVPGDDSGEAIPAPAPSRYSRAPFLVDSSQTWGNPSIFPTLRADLMAMLASLRPVEYDQKAVLRLPRLIEDVPEWLRALAEQPALSGTEVQRLRRTLSERLATAVGWDERSATTRSLLVHDSSDYWQKQSGRWTLGLSKVVEAYMDRYFAPFKVRVRQKHRTIQLRIAYLPLNTAEGWTPVSSTTMVFNIGRMLVEWMTGPTSIPVEFDSLGSPTFCDYVVSIVEHELLHMVLGIVSPEHSHCNGGHTPLFCHLLSRLFAQTRYEIEHVSTVGSPTPGELKTGTTVRVRLQQFPEPRWERATVSYVSPFGSYAHLSLDEISRDREHVFYASSFQRGAAGFSRQQAYKTMRHLLPFVPLTEIRLVSKSRLSTAPSVLLVPWQLSDTQCDAYADSLWSIL